MEILQKKEKEEEGGRRSRKKKKQLDVVVYACSTGICVAEAGG